VSNETAGERLLAWIERAGLTQREFAADLGISEGQVSSLIAGRRTPSLSLAVVIEKRTGIPASSWVVAPAQEGASA
jgi:transcriptional regulator with XRE-family HTH domain